MPQFGLTPTSTTPLSTNQFPVSAARVPNLDSAGSLTAVEGMAVNTDTYNFQTTAIRMGLKDGDDATQGLIGDSAVTGDVSGTISAKLRGLNKIFAQLQFDGSNFLKVNIAAGTVAASQSGTWNINNISGTISLPTGAAQDATVAKLNISPSTVLGSNSGPLVQGSVTTSSPTYTTGNINPLSLTTAGALRVDATATTQPISAASLPLPFGAATSAKQPALGTAGSASTDVLTVQGITSMTPLKVDGSGVTQPVSGTITANAGTGNFTVVQSTGTNLHAVLDSGSTTAVTQATASNLNAQVVGSVASAGSNAGNPVKVGGAYNSTQPTVTTGQIVDAQMTARGAQIVATGVDAFAVNASQSGTWNITNVSGTVSLPTGAATSAKQPALGTAGSASTDVLTVQGIASMTALKVDGSAVTQPVSGTVTANVGTTNGLALDTSVNGILLSQGSTTSGQKGSLVQGAVTTSAPTYTTAQTSPLSLDTSGLLRVSLKDTPANTTNLNVALAASSATVTVSASGNFNNATVGSTGSAVPASATYIGANKSGNLTGLSLDGSGNLNVNVAAGSGSNAAASATGSAVPASADYGGINVAGTLRGQTGVNPSGSIYAGQVDLASVAGTTADTNSGNKSAGTLRVILATDQPQLTNSLKVDGSGVTQPVSGAVTANAGTGTFNVQQSNITTDYDTGAGTQTMTMFGMALPASGGAVAGGTSSNPLRIDPTGTTTQPVSGTVTANAGSGTFNIQSNASVNVNQIAGSSVATAATGIMKVGLTDGTGTAITSTSNAIDVNIKSGGGSGFSVTDEAAWTAGTSAFVPTGGVFNDSAAALTSGQEGTVRVTNNRAIHVNLRDASANQLLGSKTSANSIPVVVASDQGALPVSQSGTWTVQPGNTQNSTAWLTQDAADGPVAAGTVASKSILGGLVYNSSAPAPTSGQQMAMQADQAGNIRIFPGVALTSLSAWNSGTSLNATQTIFTNSGTPAVLVQLTQTTTITAGAATFEVTYDGSNWLTIPANDVVDPTSTTFAQISLPYSLQASTNKQFLLLMNGAQGLRIKLSTQISGTGTATPNYALLAKSPLGQVVALSPTAANFNVSAVQSGTWNINNVSGTISLPTGAATSAKQPALGTAGSASSDVLTVQGIASMTALKVDGSAVTQPVSGTVTANIGTTNGLALDTSINGILLSQGSTTSGQKGPLTLGAVTTSAPSYTTAQSSPLSLTTSGALRVDGSATTQPVSGTITANIGTSGSLALDATVAKLNVAQSAALGSNTGPMMQGSVTTNAPSYTTGNINPLSLDTAGLLRVSLKDTPANTNNLNVALAASSATVTVTATNLQTNLNQIAGSAISTAASGVQKVGVVGNTGATIDSTVGAGTAPTNAIVTGSVYNSSAPAPTNGQAMALQSDQAGNIRTFPGIALASLSAWNSGTSLNATQNIFTNSGAASVLVQLTQTTTLTAGAVTFEVNYDGSNWSTIPASCVLDPTSTTFAQISLPYTVQASTNKQFLLNMNGAQGLRIKLSTQISGSGSVTPNYALLPLSPADTVIALSPTAANFNVTANQGGTWNINNVSGTVSLPTGAATAAKQPALGTAGSASSDVITVQGIASMTALKVDGSAVTQPVSGTVTANIGTTNGLALDTSVNGILLSQGSTTSGQKGSLIQGAVTTNAPSYTTAQTSPLSLDTSGLLRASLKDTPSNTNNLNVNLAASAATVTVSGTVTANQGGSNWSTNVAQIGGTNVVTGGASGLLAVGGPVASGASNADNPVKVGGAYNSTQPTVTTGQIVDAQMTARGAQIVATGVDTFTVTANAGTNLNTSALALESGGNLATLAGGVTSSKYQANVAQFGGNNVVTGTGASGSGIPRVTVSNDSETQLWDGTNGPVAVKAANTPATLTDKPIVQIISPNNTGLPVNTPAIVQKAVNKSSGSVASLAQAFSSNNTAGNSIIVVCGVGNGTAPTISDTNSNTYTQAVQIANSTTLNVAIFYAVGIATGANTVTVNNGGTTASIAMEIYELSGLIAQVRAQPDQTASNTGSSGTASTSTISAFTPNEYAFAGVGIGTAAQTITAGSGWTNDSGQQNPTTPAGLFSFVSMSQYLGSLASVTPQATFTSEPWAIAVATFRPVLLGVEGTAKITDGTVTMSFGSKTSANSMPVVVASDQGAIPVSQSGTWTVQPGNTANSTAWLVQDVAATSGGSTASHTMSGASTNATSLKGSAGMIYGFSISNANASARYFKLYNKASSPTVGTDTPVMTVQVPGNGTVIRAFPVGLVFGTGIAWAATGGIADSDTTAIGSNDCSIDIDYK